MENKIKPLQIGGLTADVPIVQGGMGVGISLSKLAGSVAANGGVGILSAAQIGFREPGFEEDPVGTNLKAIGKEIEKARKIARGGIIGINIMTATKRYEEYVQAAVEAGVDLIISGAGLPADLPKFVEGSQTRIAPIVSTLKGVRVICGLWNRHYGKIPDLIVIEGPKAGGHLGFTREQMEIYTPEVYEEEIRKIICWIREYGEKCGQYIPVVLAGGIFDRQDFLRALEMGADGVQMGTRFVTTYECDASEEYKQEYLNAGKEDVVLVDSPVGMIGRALKNTFVQSREKRKNIEKCYQCVKTCNPATTPYCITQALVEAAKGETDDALVFCGENVWKCEKMEHVEDIIKEICGR